MSKKDREIEELGNRVAMLEEVLWDALTVLFEGLDLSVVKLKDESAGELIGGQRV